MGAGVNGLAAHQRLWPADSSTVPLPDTTDFPSPTRTLSVPPKWRTFWRNWPTPLILCLCLVCTYESQYQTINLRFSSTKATA